MNLGINNQKSSPNFTGVFKLLDERVAKKTQRLLPEKYSEELSTKVRDIFGERCFHDGHITSPCIITPQEADSNIFKQLHALGLKFQYDSTDIFKKINTGGQTIFLDELRKLFGKEGTK